jgi:hypothetical protein
MSNQLCCSACRLRFTPDSATVHGTCPRCDEPLASMAPKDAMGYPLYAPTPSGWEPAGLDALAHAVADVIATRAVVSQTGGRAQAAAAVQQRRLRAGHAGDA